MERTLRLLPRHQLWFDLARQTPGVDSTSVGTYLLFSRIAHEVFAAQQAFYDRYEEQRLSLPLPAPARPADQQLGPVRVKWGKLTMDPASGAEIQLRLEWPAGTQVSLYGRNGVQVALKENAAAASARRTA